MRMKGREKLVQQAETTTLKEWAQANAIDLVSCVFCQNPATAFISDS